MAKFFSKTGESFIIPHKKVTRQGDGPRTKVTNRKNASKRKISRGQGRS